MEVVLDGLVLGSQFARVHRLNEGNGSKDAVEAVAHDRGQMEISFTSLLLDDAVDHVLGRSEENLTLKESLQVLVVALHLHEVNAHVFLSLGMIVESSEHLTEISHVDTSLMEEVSQGLGINRDSFLLFQVIDHVRDRLVGDKSGQALDIILFGFDLSCGHIELAALLVDIGVEAVLG